MNLVQIETTKNFRLKTPTDNLSVLYSTGQKLEKMCKELKTYGLSAIQFGLNWNFFVYSLDLNNFRYVFDCDYAPVDERKFDSIEKCVSFGANYYKIKRHDKIRSTGKIIIHEEKFKIDTFDKEISGLESVVFQHEVDHQKHIWISEIGNKIDFLGVYK